MSPNDWRGRTVLITGGTRGIGLETGLAFARVGARTILTFRWGGHEAQAIGRFAAEGLPAPELVQVDAADLAATRAMLQRNKTEHEQIDAFVSNVAFGPMTRELDDYSPRALQRGLDSSAWPLVQHTLLIQSIFGQYPRYVVGVSSLGGQSLGLHYDLIAASKAVLETFVRHLAWRLRDQGVRVNAVTAGLARTESSVGAGGEDFAAFEAWHEAAIGPIPYVEPAAVAGAIFALCSGHLDGMTGQILTVDDGSFGFSSSRYALYREHLQHKRPGDSP